MLSDLDHRNTDAPALFSALSHRAADLGTEEHIHHWTTCLGMGWAVFFIFHSLEIEYWI